MSASSGTSKKLDRPGASSAAQIIGSAAFFEPETVTSPASGLPPWITIESTSHLGCHARDHDAVVAREVLRPPPPRKPRRSAQRDHFLGLGRIDLEQERPSRTEPA